MTTSTQGNAALLQAMMNLTKFHREHEKFYASSPREFAVTLRRHARTLQALADQWSTTEASTRAVLSPYEGADDLNSHAALQLEGPALPAPSAQPACHQRPAPQHLAATSLPEQSQTGHAASDATDPWRGV